mgnify:CR=1 FL=1
MVYWGSNTCFYEGVFRLKVAVVGSRKAGEQAMRQILQYLPSNTSEIVSGGAVGIDALASQIAALLKLPIRTFLPDYAQYGKKAPLIRNTEIVHYADLILAFWDGSSHGTQQVVAECIRLQKPVRLISLEDAASSESDGSCV